MHKQFKLAIQSPIHEPETPPAADACWRCGGLGTVRMKAHSITCAEDGELQPCGACMGTKVPPRPCPKCGSKHVKIATDGLGHFLMCRGCLFGGPSRRNQMLAYKAWQENPEGS